MVSIKHAQIFLFQLFEKQQRLNTMKSKGLLTNMVMLLHNEEHESLENWAVIILALIIIAFSASFELCNAGVMRWLKNQELTGLQDMLNAVFKELTILGFITLMLFTSVRTGAAQIINDKIFGQSKTEKTAVQEALENGLRPAPPTTLQELFEDIHILIFVIMVMYIVETAVLLIVGRRTIRTFEALDQLEEKDLRELVMDRSQQHNRSLLRQQNAMLIFYSLRRRFLYPRLDALRVTRSPEFEFSKYIVGCYTELLVELIELPVTSLLIILIISLLLRPFMGLEGTRFLIFMITVACALMVLTVAMTFAVGRVYALLLPNLPNVRAYLTTTAAVTEGGTSNLLRSPRYEEAFSAPIDSLPVYAKTTFGPRNRIDRQFPGYSVKHFRTLLQLLLFFNAAFAAIVCRDSLSMRPEEIQLWWVRRWWFYPFLLGITMENLRLWIRLVSEFSFICALDCNVNLDIVKKVDEDFERRQLLRHIQILRFLIHKADHVHTTKSQEKREAEMERVSLEFAHLPSSHKNLLTLVFATVSRYQDRLGDEAMRGVVTKQDMREALRLMGWVGEDDKTADYILSSWFEERDENQQGFLTFTKFIEVIMLSTRLGEALKDPRETRTTRRERLQALFDALDANRDQKISVSEFLKVLQGLTPPATEKEVERLVSNLSHGDSFVTLKELQAFVDYIETVARSEAPAVK